MSKSLRALLIEDSQDDARLVLQALKSSGYDVTWERADTAAAMQAALARSEWDIVLADYRMPHFSGPAALQLLRDSGRDIPLILVSGTIGEEVAVDALRAGASDFVMKDRLARLAPAVERELRDVQARRERQDMEARFRLEQERFRALVEKSWEVVSVTDWAGWLTYTSPAIQRILGYPVDEFVGRNFSDFVHPDDLGDVQEALAGVQRQPADTCRREFRCRNRDGTWRWFSAIISNLLDDPGVRGIVINYRDISERKQAEETIHRREQEFRALVQQAPDTIAQYDREQHCLYINHPENVEKAPRGDSAGKSEAPPGGTMTPNPILRRSIEEVFVSAREATIEYELPGERGVRIYQTRLAPVLAQDGVVESVIAIARDITAGRQLEEQYRHAQKMEAIGQLAGGIAHDFNNILTIVQMQSSLLLAVPGLDAKVGTGVRRIQDATSRASGLTRQLLTFSRRHSKQAHDLNLAQVIGPMIKLLRSVLGEDIELVTEYAPDLPSINADPGMMEQILMNLAVNARDAMSGGGRLTVGVGTADIDAARAAIHAVTPGRFVCLRVGDTGCGIPRENLPRLFEPFFTTKEVGKGTGLGLATVFGIVQQHHGWIEVESEVGKGTAFSVFLPANTAGSAPRPAASGVPSIRGGTETILLVEDDATVRTLVRFVLKHYGYTVLEADGPAAALKIWDEKEQSIQLLVTDLIMPGGITGRQLADMLIARRPDLRIIYTSGYSNETVAQQLTLGPGRMFLHKPYPAHDLALAVRRCCDGA